MRNLMRGFGQTQVGVAVMLLVLAGVGALVASPGGVRLGVALAATLVLVSLALRSAGLVLAPLVVWFVLLGLARRLILGVNAQETYGDPLLLVGAGTWVVLALLALHRGALVNRGRFTRAVLVLISLLAVSALNPLQGGLAVGLGGALLVVVPMAAFFVGRSLIPDALLQRLFLLVACLGLVVAAYGLYQTFVGFPSWDQRWIEQQGNVALNVNGVIRAFSSFSAASEYATFLGIAIVIWVARARGLARSVIGMIALGVLGTAMWYESSRGIVVFSVIAVASVLAARSGLTLRRGLLVGAALLFALPLVIGRLAPTQSSNDPGARLAQHQVDGLSDPLGAGSTLPVHITSIIGGLTSAIRDPIGIGVGSITISGEKYGGAVRPTEADPSNAAVAAGLPGLLAYLAVVFLALPSVYRQASHRRDSLSLAALGVLVVTSLQWLNGGQYATMFWPWLILGWSDARRELTSDEADANALEKTDVSA